MSYWDLDFEEFSREYDIRWSVRYTHKEDDVRKLSVKPLLYIIEEIFQPATPSVPGFGQGTEVQLNVSDDNAFQFDFDVMLDLLSSTINEISNKISSDGDEHQITMGILKTLGSYNWDAKVVLALVAFAFNFGDFLVMAQPYSSNPLLKSVPLLPELPKTQEQVVTFKPKFVELSNLIKATLNMTKCIVEFIEFHNYISYSLEADIQLAVYWTIQCTVGCALQILGLTGMGRGKISAIAETKSAQRISSKHIYLKKQLNELKEKERSKEASEKLEELMKEVHTDNIQVMRGLIYAKEDQRPLLKGDTETRASIEVLWSKNVLLLISDMKITDEELFILKKMYRESHNDPTRSRYEVVWIPIVDRSTPWTHAMQDQFENCQLRMPWYSVYHPLMIDSAVITYIEKVWNFKENPILVVIDPKGNVVNNNAFHIIWIWRDLAFPFTSSREADLWASATWTFEFLAGSIATAIPFWRAEDNYICLYGGGNMDWIKKFTNTAQTVAEATHIKLQILYVGKSNPEKQIQGNISMITEEKLSYSLQDPTQVWLFWKRLKSMHQSRMHFPGTEENDPIMQKINTILSFDEKDEGWVVFCRGSNIAIAKSENILQCLTNFDLWRKYMTDQDFVIALNHYNRKISLAQLMESQHLDNMNVLRALIYTKEDQLPLLKCDTKTRVSIEVLKSKIVLLLISDEEFADEELFMLRKMYKEPRQDTAREESQCVVLWIPVVDRLTEWNGARQQQFENHQSNMPWYSVYHPSLIDPAVFIYIQEVLHFNKKPILVVLDPQGKLVNNNALHVLWIWGMQGFPFTSAREEELWKQQTWGIKLLADSINENIPKWIADENCICLYGGGNIDWIRKFTANAQAVAEVAHIKLQILYVGKSNHGEQINRNIFTITKEKLSHSLQDLPHVKFFWERLKIIYNSRMTHGCTLGNDLIMQEIYTILSFDQIDEGWAVFCGASDMAIAKSENILQCLSDFNLWRASMNEKEFVTTLKDYHRKVLHVQLMESPDKDNTKVLRAVIQAKEDQKPLFKGDAKETASIEVLKSTTVLLLISNELFADEELFMLKKTYKESREKCQYEVVWIPVVDRSTEWNDARQQRFENQRSNMQWYSVYHPLLIDPAVIIYIQQVRHFNKKPILVVLDPQGKPVNYNALHMLWIWGRQGFPFTSAKDEELWKQQTWGIKLLADSINEDIPKWIADENCICLYGGGNINWIREFTANAQAVAEAAQIKLQILYVGKSNPGEQINRNLITITKDKLGHSLQDLPPVKFFWERLKIIYNSRMTLGSTLGNDPIMQGINTILSFDKNDEGWAVFCTASDMAIAKSENILQCLRDFNLWRTYMNEKEFVTTLKHYHRKVLLVQLMESPHKDNMEVLRTLIRANEYQPPLFKGDAKATIEVLKNKTVLFLISDLEFADEELFMLKKMYAESRQFEMVWIPVVDRSTPSTEAKENQFLIHQQKMPWYSVSHHSVIDLGVVMYIEQVWNFKKKPILVVLDPQGKMVNNNALHMLLIWGSLAFPFTSAREEELWKQQIWRIELLADSINEAIPTWIADENCICLYGGGNIDWIRKFTANAQTVAEAVHIKFQILYVGKSNPGEQIQGNISTITEEKLSHSLQDLPLVRFFWERLKIIRHSRMKLGFTLENDPIMQDINTILSFDNSDEGWAVFCRGSAMAIAKSEIILQCLTNFDLWRKYMNDQDLVIALSHYNRKFSLAQLMESQHTDNMKVLRELIYAKEDQMPLFDGYTRTTVSIEVLKTKTVLLLISDEKFDDEELLSMLEKMYAESRQFEMVWIPVVDRSTPWTVEQENQVLMNQCRMPWYSVRHPSIIDLAVVMYIVEVWNFKKKPILVVLDPQGKLVNDNALHMLRLWGSLAFPFTIAKEAELWKQQTSGIKLLADSMNEAIPNWIAEENYKCLYGGGNIDWIKKFTAKAQAVAEAAHIKLQILYVGKSHPGEKIDGNISTITEEKLSHSLQDLPLVRFFWERLKSLQQSRMHLGGTEENDPVMQEINTILLFDEKDEEWAVFCRGSAMAMANGEIILQCLSDFDLWRTYMNDKDFVTALNHYGLVKLMESPHKDNLEILRALIYAKEDQLPLLKGDTKERAGIEVLKSKTLLLLISDLEFSNEEPFMLEQSYKSSRQDPSKQYEIVWIPVVDRSTQWNKAKQGQFENHQSRMPWYSVYHPLMIKPGVLMYIEQAWNFKKKPIVVALEPEGKVINNNALHMLRIWGSLAFPFTSTREAELWTQEISRIELLADSIDATIPFWIQEENYICLYGGENIDWIREFTATARKVAEAASIQLQILYVGKSNSNEEQVRQITDTITVEKLSHSLQEYHQVWFFWQRLESMWHSKTQFGCTVENDPILEEINTLLSFDKNQEGWAVLCRGTAMAKAKGVAILQCLKDFDSWKTHMEDKDFVTALNHHLNQLQKPTPMGETEHN